MRSSRSPVEQRCCRAVLCVRPLRHRYAFQPPYAESRVGLSGSPAALPLLRSCDDGSVCSGVCLFAVETRFVDMEASPIGVAVPWLVLIVARRKGFVRTNFGMHGHGVYDHSDRATHWPSAAIWCSVRVAVATIERAVGESSNLGVVRWKNTGGHGKRSPRIEESPRHRDRGGTPAPTLPSGPCFGVTPLCRAPAAECLLRKP